MDSHDEHLPTKPRLLLLRERAGLKLYSVSLVCINVSSPHHEKVPIYRIAHCQVIQRAVMIDTCYRKIRIETRKFHEKSSKFILESLFMKFWAFFVEG